MKTEEHLERQILQLKMTLAAVRERIRALERERDSMEAILNQCRDELHACRLRREREKLRGRR